MLCLVSPFKNSECYHRLFNSWYLEAVLYLNGIGHIHNSCVQVTLGKIDAMSSAQVYVFACEGTESIVIAHIDRMHSVTNSK